MTQEKLLWIVRESVAKSLARDVGSFALVLSLIGIGVFLESDAMQWTGAIMAFIVIIAKSSGKVKYLTLDQAEAKLKRMREGLE